jgi:hypothetical protein
MCLQNRVDPSGAVHANPARGLFMGNRGGKIHDPTTKTLLSRRFASRRWIICVCVYRDWHRDVMGDGYTELFFLDEVTALSAGHRPCAFCRRMAFKQYCAAAEPEAARVRVDDVDLKLHAERLGSGPSLKEVRQADFPDGTMVSIGSKAFAKRGALALPWTFDGYGEPADWLDIIKQDPALLTPLTSVKALANGYTPVWHPSAGA